MYAKKLFNLYPEYKLVIIVTLLAFLGRITFLSTWLEDWDSVQFAQGLHNYSIILNQPHAPGYPLYELMGKFLLFFLQNDNKSLTLLSALLGTLISIPLYLLTKSMFNKRVALATITIFLVTPVGWTLSEVALTNIPGLFFLVLYTYLLYKYKNNPKVIPKISFFGGIILGVRFTEFPIIISLLLFILLKLKNTRLAINALFAFFLGLALWLIPLIIISTPKGFIESYQTIASYITYHDSVINKNLGLFTTLKFRIKNLWYLLSIGYTNIFLILTATNLTILIFKNKLKDYNYQFLILWLLSYLLPLSFYYNLEVTRYTLPLLPPLALINSSITYSYLKGKSYILIIGIIFLLLSNRSLDQLVRFAKATPPNIASMQYVTKNYASKDISVIATYTFRQFQYYAPTYNVYYGDQITGNEQLKEYVAIDYLGLKSKIKMLENYEIIQKQVFVGDKDIFNRLNKVEIYILKKQK